MAERGTLVLQSTSLEGNAVISIRGFVPIGLGGGGGSSCTLGAPDMNWDLYGGGDGVTPAVTGFYLPVVEESTGGAGGQDDVFGFEVEVPFGRSLSLEVNNDPPFNVRVREEFWYCECVEGWETYALKITLTEVVGAGAGGFEIRESEVPPSRTDDGFLHTMTGGPDELLSFPGGMNPTPPETQPVRDGTILYDESAFPDVGDFVTITNPKGRAFVLRPKFQDPDDVSGQNGYTFLFERTLV